MKKTKVNFQIISSFKINKYKNTINKKIKIYLKNNKTKL